MMETIFFSFILVLITIWIMLGILYFYTRCVSPCGVLIKRNKKYNEQIGGNEAAKKEDEQEGEGTGEQTEFVLIGRSRSVSLIIPQASSASSSKDSKQNSNSFAPQNFESKDDMKEEDSKIKVSYEMEGEDENEIAHEELSLPIESAFKDGKVPSQSILACDLGHMRKWRKNSDEVDDAEVKGIAGQLKDTDFMEKYKEYIAKMQGEQSILLDKIRRAEEEQEQADELSTFNVSRESSSDSMMTKADSMDERPLLYYLQTNTLTHIIEL